MSNDFSMVGYESVSIAEYLPILENIKHDLKFIHETFNSKRILGTMNFETIQPDTKPTSPVNNKFSIDSTDAHSLHPECERQVLEKLQKIELLIPKNHDSLSDNLVEIINKLESHFRSAIREKDDESTIENSSMGDELTEYKKQIKEKEAIINQKNDEIEQFKEKQIDTDSKIENFKTQIKSLTEEIQQKADKIEVIHKNNKSLKDQIVGQDQKVEQLTQEIKTLQRQTKSPTNPEEIKKSNPEMKKMLEEKIQLITELEAKINKLESINWEKSENQEKMKELENKIRQLTLDNENIYAKVEEEFQRNLSKKKKDIKERDIRISELENENMEFETKLRKLEREARILRRKDIENKQEISDLEANKDELEAKMKVIKKEIKTLKNRSEHEEEMTNNSEEVNSLKAALKTKENESNKIINELKTKLSESQDKLKAKETELNSEKEAKMLEIEKLNTNIENLKRDCEKKQTAIVTMRTKINTKNEDKSTPTEIKRYLNQIKSKEMESDQLHAKVENLNEAFDKKCMEHELAIQEVANLKAEIENMKRLQITGKAPATLPRASGNAANEFPTWWGKHMER